MPQGDELESSPNRETDREGRGSGGVKEKQRQEGGREADRERFGNDTEEQVGEESR